MRSVVTTVDDVGGREFVRRRVWIGWPENEDSEEDEDMAEVTWTGELAADVWPG